MTFPLRWLVLGCLLLPAHGQEGVAAVPKAKPAKKPAFPLPPDTRPPGCNELVVDPTGRDFEDLKVSIIIPYRNEKWDHIRGSLDSILYYTPRKYLAEIMWVSDGNSEASMYIDEIRAMAPKLMSFLVLPEPGVGLIEAKMRAVEAAATNSTVLLFLEPHIRVNRHWIQPLLRRIREYPQVLAMPSLDLIPQDDFNQYIAGDYGTWRFEWNFNIAYTNPGNLHPNSPDPYPSPATSGGVFAIRRDFWNSLGFYDSGMIGWGGDHIEATLKVWRCGGHIDIIPCSRIGHLFRDADHRPYAVATDQVVRNYARVANVWLEEYLEKFYYVKGDAREMDIGDLSEQFALKEGLQCKSMQWYLENVDIEMNWEKDRICIPGCDRGTLGAVCCERPAHGGRSTIDRHMPPEEWSRLELTSPTAEELRLMGHGEEL